MLRYLWRNRERPSRLSLRWLVVWVKRLLTLPSLLRVLLRRKYLRLRGARLAELVIVERCRIIGPPRRLSVGAGSFIGDGSELMLHEAVTVGSRVVINSGVRILTASHDLRDPAWRARRLPVSIGDYAWIATGAMLLPGVRIGYGAVVGAGAVVRKDVADYAVVAGNPAAISAAERCRGLDYNPAAFTAPVEAWLGRPR